MTLSTWLSLVYAIGTVESGWRSDLPLGAAGEIGSLQVTPVVVAEVNRRTGEDWRHDLCRDDTYAITFFRRFVESCCPPDVTPERIARQWHRTTDWRDKHAGRYWRKVKREMEKHRDTSTP